jgi:putrescine---pyruvate transaminase
MVSPFLHPFTSPAKPRAEFITIVRGAGALVYDDEGNEYIDAMASLWYANIGYGNREMAAAIAAQVERLPAFHTFTTFTNEPAEELAARVADLSPFRAARVFLCGSGSEAVDSVMKIARLVQAVRGAPERTLIVSRERAYHGVNYGGTSISGLPMNMEGFGPYLAATVNVDAEDLGKMEAVLNEHSGEVAAVITEPVQGAGGVFPPNDGYLQGLRRLCDDHGALLIFDEVITGYGRLGTWFAAQRFGVTPDLISFAKAVTSGYLPLGGVVVGDDAAAALESAEDLLLRHGYTYSGHPTVCAAGVKNLEILERDGLLRRADVIEDRLGSALRAIGAGGRLRDVRGIGGMWAVGTPDGVDENVVSVDMRRGGVLARPVYGSLIFCPPLVVSDEQIDAIAEGLDAALPG